MKPVLPDERHWIKIYLLQRLECGYSCGLAADHISLMVRFLVMDWVRHQGVGITHGLT